MRNKHHLLLAVVFALGTAALAGAQVLDDSKPATTNVAGAQYPRVSSDGRVTFQVKAPTAQKVQIEPGNGMVGNNGYNGLGKAPYDMAKDQNGLWTVTTPPAVPGFHYYWLLVDGVAVNDPFSETFFGYSKEVSGVEVPEPGAGFYLLKAVPHGEIRQHWYYSKLTSADRPIMVYTPPGYDINITQRYPVLYLQHGGGENYRGWFRQGRVNLILDNLIAEGKAKPMIIVMENGSVGGPGAGGPPPGAAGARGSGAPSGRTPAGGAASAGRDGLPSPGMGALGDIFAKELIPYIDATFRTLADRDHRAMAGLSMGSAQTLQITMTHLDTFSYVGVFSRPPDNNFSIETSYNGVFKDAAAFNRKIHLFWWGAGTAEPLIYQGVKATHEALDKANIKNVYVEYPGLSHEWQVWRKQLHDYAPMLFQ